MNNNDNIKICRICDSRYEADIEVDDEDTCQDCWDSVYEAFIDDEELLSEDGLENLNG